MKRIVCLLLSLLLLLSLCACGGGETRTMPELESGEFSGPEDTSEPDLDLTACHDPEEAYLELEHLNRDPTGYLGMSMRLQGVFSMYESHGKTFYYCGVRDMDGCVENMELSFPDGLPEGFPAPGEDVTVRGRVSSYTVERNGESYVCAILEEARLEGENFS